MELKPEVWVLLSLTFYGHTALLKLCFQGRSTQDLWIIRHKHKTVKFTIQRKYSKVEFNLYFGFAGLDPLLWFQDYCLISWLFAWVSISSFNFPKHQDCMRKISQRMLEETFLTSWLSGLFAQRMTQCVIKSFNNSFDRLTLNRPSSLFPAQHLSGKMEIHG